MMSEEETAEADTGKKTKRNKKEDHTAIEFSLGNIEFEAKGRSKVVERMFRMLLEKIEEGKLVAEFRLQEPDEDEEEEEMTFTPPESLYEPEIPEPPRMDEEATLDPPPEWDSLETEEPEVSDAEREELGIE